MPSALANYYQAMANEKTNAIGLTNAQIQGQTLNNGNIDANAAADRAQRFGAATLANTQAGSIAANTPSEIAERQAQTGVIGSNAAAEQGLKQSQTGYYASQTSGNRLANSLTSLSLGVDASGNPITGGTPGGAPATPGVLRYAHGTSHVTLKGKGSKPAKGTATDHIPALLSDGEAVLNRGAAEHMGRGVIDHLNKLGMMRMAAQHEVGKHVAKIKEHAGKGGKPKPGGIGHYLGGVANVQPAPAAPTGSAPSGGGLNLAALLGGQGSGPAGGGDPLSAALASLGGPSPGQGGAPAAPAGGGSPAPKSPSRHHKRR